MDNEPYFYFLYILQKNANLSAPNDPEVILKEDGRAHERTWGHKN